MKKPVKILIVDDEEDLCWVLSNILRHEGYNVTCVQNAQEAITRINKGRFNIAFIDIALPDMSGMEVYNVIKKISPTTVAVMTTGYLSEEDMVQKAIKDGSLYFLYKPFEIEEILDVIKKNLD